MTNAAILASLAPVHYEPSCVVPEDESEVVRHAWQVDPHAREKLREQAIARLVRDEAAVQARERRIAMARGRVIRFRGRA